MQDGGSGSQVDELERELLRELTRNVGVSRVDATPREWLRATSLAIRGRIVDRFHAMNARVRAQPARSRSATCRWNSSSRASSKAR